MPRPLLELIDGLTWRVAVGAPNINVQTHTATAPWDDSPRARLDRLLQYGTARFGQLDPAELGYPEPTVRACESALMHFQLEDELEESREGEEVIRELMQGITLEDLAIPEALSFYDECVKKKEFDGQRAVVEYLVSKSQHQAVLGIMGDLGQQHRRHRLLWQTINSVRSIMWDTYWDQAVLSRWDTKANERAVAAGAHAISAEFAPPSRKKVTPSAARHRIKEHGKVETVDDADERTEQMRKGTGVKPDMLPRLVDWGKLKIVPLQDSAVYRAQNRRARRPADYGTTVARIDRIISDKRIFAGPRPGVAGSLLIDNSGSMALYDWQLEEILDLAPAAIIGAYSGAGDSGELRILAYNGRRVRKIDQTLALGGNVVDGPSLEWLAEQRGPRYWVSDTHVTGVSDMPSSILRAQCLNFCRRRRISLFFTLDEFIKAMRMKAKAEAARGRGAR